MNSMLLFCIKISITVHVQANILKDGGVQQETPEEVFYGFETLIRGESLRLPEHEIIFFRLLQAITVVFRHPVWHHQLCLTMGLFPSKFHHHIISPASKYKIKTQS